MHHIMGRIFVDSLAVPMITAAMRYASNTRGGGIGATPIPISISIEPNPLIAGQAAKFRIVGAPPNALIYWSSFKNGAHTGEDNAQYGDSTAGNGTAELPYTPRAEDVGSWQKIARIRDANGSDYQGIVNYTVLPAGAGAGAGAGPLDPTAGAGMLDGLISGSINILGVQVPTIALVGGVVIGAFALSRRK